MPIYCDDAMIYLRNYRRRPKLWIIDKTRNSFSISGQNSAHKFPAHLSPAPTVLSRGEKINSRRRRFLFQRLLLAASLKIKCQFLSSILLLTGRWANVSFVERKVRLEWNVRTVGRTAVAAISKMYNFDKLPHSFLHPARYFYCSTAHYFSCYMPTLSGLEREIKKQERKHKI